MNNCIFCKIIEGVIPSNKVYEDDQVLAFHDIDPQAPVHVLIIPKKHVGSVMELTGDDQALLAHLVEVTQQLATELGIAKEGFRLVCNTGDFGGQTVPHLHIHLIGGRALGWPPG